MAQFPTTHNQFALSHDQREEFAELGVLRLPGLLSDGAVRHAREAALEPWRGSASGATAPGGSTRCRGRSTPRRA